VGLLALVAQLSFAAFVPPDAPVKTLFAALDQPSAICSSDHRDGGSGMPSQWHQTIDLAVCPLNLDLGRQDLTVAVGSVFLLPFTTLIARIFLTPPGRGPPEPAARVGLPRAPPQLD
jgi:hypothetical protein